MGNKTDVVVPYQEWLKIMEMLDELDSIRDYDAAKRDAEFVDWNEAQQQIKNPGN